MRLVAMGGSLRKESLNRRLLLHLSETLESNEHEVKRIFGEDLRLPLYDADLTVPESVTALQEILGQAQGLILVSRNTTRALI